MATRRLRMEEAYKYVKSRRRIVSPNFSFMGQLLTFENQIFSASSTRFHSSSSPSSPLLAFDASTPDPDALTPSRGASQQNVFDFATLPTSIGNQDLEVATVTVSEHEFTTFEESAAEKLTLATGLT